MFQNVEDGAFGLAAQGDPGSRSLGEQRKGDGAVRKRWLVHHFEQAIAYGKRFCFADFSVCTARRANQSFAKSRLSRRLLLDVAQQESVEDPSLAKIQTHPLFGTALGVNGCAAGDS